MDLKNEIKIKLIKATLIILNAVIELLTNENFLLTIFVSSCGINLSITFESFLTPKADYEFWSRIYQTYISACQVLSTAILIGSGVSARKNRKIINTTKLK